jgi:hypothetical protein
MQDTTRMNEAKPPEYDWTAELIAFLLAAMVSAAMVAEWLWWTRSELGK